MENTTIRAQCLVAAWQDWQQPTSEEIREVLRLAELSGTEASLVLGLAGSKTIRRWVGEVTPIPYAAWAVLCDYAGLGIIWRSASTNNSEALPQDHAD